jgi:hypothetical protein
MKDILPNLLRLLLTAALVFIGVELHRMNERLSDSLDVKVSSGRLSRGALEVDINSPIKIDSDSRLGLPVTIRSGER